MSARHFPVAVILLALGMPHCAAADEAEDLAAVQARELRKWDDRLNDVYGQISEILDEQQRRELQEAQRAWLRWRNDECHTNNGTDREAWIASVAADKGVMDCVYGATMSRVMELRRELEGARDPNYPSRVNPQSRFRKWSTLMHSSGKWYFEVTADIGAIARLQPTDFYAGFVVDNELRGTVGSIRAGDSGQPVLVYGLAADLDEGRYYLSLNGVWQGAVPGSAAGNPLALGKSYGATVGTREGTNRLLLANAIQPRFGSEPFVYPIPQGYRAWRDLTCVEPQNSREVALCLGEELRKADEEINTSYQALQAALDTAGRDALRSEQRAWIVQRDAECGITNSQGDRDIWYRTVLSNGERALCVVRLTRARNTELRLRAAGTPASAAIPQKRTDYLMNPPLKRNSGRWYYEIMLHPQPILRLSPAAEFSVGCGENDTGTAAMYLVKLFDPGLVNVPTTIGVAVDFDAGKLFASVDGAWSSGSPTSGGGLAVLKDTPYTCGVHSSVNLTDLKARGFIEARFGDGAPFRLPVPEGYRGLASTP